MARITPELDAQIAAQCEALRKKTVAVGATTVTTKPVAVSVVNPETNEQKGGTQKDTSSWWKFWR